MNKNKMTLIVLDAKSVTVNEYTIPKDIAKSAECVEEFIEDQGHDLDVCQYMVAKQVEYRSH